MLWYLANSSLNAYLKSQITLQGQYYSGQNASAVNTNFSANTGIGTFTQLALDNPKEFQRPYAIEVDEVNVELDLAKTTQSLVIVKKLTINKLQLWLEISSANSNNFENLKTQIIQKLAIDYPELYPEISAKKYANKNPTRNIALHHEASIQKALDDKKLTKAAILAKNSKKKREMPSTKIAIQSIFINHIELNVLKASEQFQLKNTNVSLVGIGGNQGIVTNQLGGEVLLSMLNMALILAEKKQ